MRAAGSSGRTLMLILSPLIIFVNESVRGRAGQGQVNMLTMEYEMEAVAGHHSLLVPCVSVP